LSGGPAHLQRRGVVSVGEEHGWLLMLHQLWMVLTRLSIIHVLLLLLLFPRNDVTCVYVILGAARRHVLQVTRTL